MFSVILFVQQMAGCIGCEFYSQRRDIIYFTAIYAKLLFCGRFEMVLEHYNLFT